MSRYLKDSIPSARPARTFAGIFVGAILIQAGALTAATKIDELLAKAQAAFTNANKAEAIALATQAIEAEPKNMQGYYVRGRVYEVQKEHAKAIADFSQVLKLDPVSSDAYQRRGSEHFKLGHIPESIADFEKFLELMPKWKPNHWQVGIAYYYAGRYADGKQQFELHQTVNPNDVENAVWHFLCAARLAGVKKAQASLMNIRVDRRIPMMTIHALFSGKAAPEDVLNAAKVEATFPEAQQRQLFYANFYIGLYYEAAGNRELAREHIFRAAAEALPADYMGDVARVHAEILKKRGVKAGNYGESRRSIATSRLHKYLFDW